MMSLKGKTALVTGAAAGFGFEFSKLLASDGLNLVLIDIDETRLTGTREFLINTYAVSVTIMVCDLSLPEAADEIYRKFKDNNIEILINNAGYGLCGHFINTRWQMEEDMINLHMYTLTKLTKMILPDMVGRGRGMIMNVSSVAAFQPGPLMAVYYASKAYILYFSEALANELKSTGVTVTVFCPGQTDTGFQKAVALKSGTTLSRTLWLDDPGKAALKGYNAMKAGKAVCIPGVKNKILAQLHRIVPRKTATSLVRLLQEKIR